MILSCDHINKTFGDRVILRDASLHIEEKKKVALIGANGIGKTTLLRILIGEEPYDSGEMTQGRDTTCGYLPQQLGYHSDLTIYEELYHVRQDILDQEAELHELEERLSKTSDDSSLERYHRLQTEFEINDGYAYKSRVLGIINGLGFGGEVMHKSINTLSGGQKTRVALGKLLLTKPDLLILDEPTNHLDITSVQWLEEYLSSYPGAVLIVSHDRYFLDRFTEVVYELENGALRRFPGNYTAYISQKDVLKKTLMRSYEKQQAEIRHQEDVIKKLRQFNREKSIRRAESRVKMLDKIERLEKPVDDEKAMHFRLEPKEQSGHDVLTLEGISKQYDEKILFTDVNLEVFRGEKIAVIGDNGTGKTTLLRMIFGKVEPDFGTIRFGTGVTSGYYDQEHGILHDDKTVFEEIQDDFPNLDHTAIRNCLAAFLFTGDDVFKPISSLSGGECGRVSLAKLMLSSANLLLLDEPTNHLDMISREILENAIREYMGTVICVSHDRYFINRTATRILDLTGGRFYDYKGDYTYYLEKRATHTEIPPSDKGGESIKAAGEKESGTDSKASWLADKEAQAKRRKLEKDYAEIEARIAELESDLAACDEALADPGVGTDLPRLTELTARRNDVEAALDEAMNRWEELGELLL